MYGHIVRLACSSWNYYSTLLPTEDFYNFLQLILVNQFNSVFQAVFYSRHVLNPPTGFQQTAGLFRSSVMNSKKQKQKNQKPHNIIITLL